MGERLRRVAGLVLFAYALAVFTALVLRVPLLDSSRLNLQPGPDGQQYLAGAVSLARDHRFAVELMGQPIPPRYPFGYSLLMVPLLAAGVTPIVVPFVVNETIGFALIAGLFAFFWRRGRWLAAGSSAALLATWPGFVIACRSPLSEVSAGAVVLLGCCALAAFGAGGRTRLGVAGALILGVSAWFKVANVFLAPLICLMPLAIVGGWRSRVRVGAWLVASYTIGIAPVLWYDTVHFGSPLATGYSLWVPYFATLSNSFGIRFASVNAAYWWGDLTGGEHVFTTANIFGTGSYFTLGLVGLIVVTAAARLRRPAEQIVALVLALNTLLMLVYAFPDGRLLFPVLLVCVPFAARETAVILESRTSGLATSAMLTAVVGLLLISAIVGYSVPRRGWDLAHLMDVARFQGPSSEYGLVERLNRRSDGHAGVVLTDLDPAYVSALSPVHHVVAPLMPYFQPFTTPPMFNAQDIRRAMTEAMATNRQVYLLVSAHTEAETLAMPVTVPPDGYQWHSLFGAGDRIRMSLLVPTSAGAP